ncbi:hypothetical protein SHIRM173S_05561 [Streptomyces hirsutus]
MGVPHREVPGAEPAVAEGLGGLLGLVPVPLAQLQHLVDDLAGCPVGYVLAVLVDHPCVHEQHGPPAGVHAPLVLVGCEDGRQRSDLALPEAVVDGQVRQPLREPLQDRHGHDRRPVVRLAQSAQVAGREVGAVGQADPDRGRGEQAVRAARLDQVEDPVAVGRVEDDVGRADREVGQQEDVHLRRVVERQRVHGEVARLGVEGGGGGQGTCARARWRRRRLGRRWCPRCERCSGLGGGSDRRG